MTRDDRRSQFFVQRRSLPPGCGCTGPLCRVLESSYKRPRRQLNSCRCCVSSNIRRHCLIESHAVIALNVAARTRKTAAPLVRCALASILKKAALRAVRKRLLMRPRTVVTSATAPLLVLLALTDRFCIDPAQAVATLRRPLLRCRVSTSSRQRETLDP